MFTLTLQFWVLKMSLAGAFVCPPLMQLPHVVQIDEIPRSVVPVEEHWQALLDGVPLSDMQLLQLADDQVRLEAIEEEMEDRGTWIYLGMGAAALGTAISSAGWALYGSNNQSVSQSATLSLALGGLALGIAGVLTVTQSIQAPLEPYTAPSPRHRITRAEMEQLVATINRRFFQEVCELTWNTCREGCGK